MSINGALITAASSLNLQQQQANVIAGNIANANTPGYVAETLQQLEHLYGNRTGVEGGTLQRLGNETAAQTLIGTFHTLSDAVASGREQADQTIAADVTTVNQTLGQLAQNQTAL